MGGTGGGIAYNREELEEILERGIDLSPVHEVLIEESVLGWKEYRAGGDARSGGQRDHRVLHREFRSDGRPYRRFDYGRSGANADRSRVSDDARCIAALPREIGVDTGGSNVQFAINPENGRMVIVEMNPRVSRRQRWRPRRQDSRLRRSPRNSP